MKNEIEIGDVLYYYSKTNSRCFAIILVTDIVPTTKYEEHCFRFLYHEHNSYIGEHHIGHLTDTTEYSYYEK